MLTFVATLALVLAAPPSDIVKHAAERAYSQEGIQRSLPSANNPLTTPKRSSAQRRKSHKREATEGTLNTISTIVFWLLTFVVLAAFALWMAREFLGYVPEAQVEAEAREREAAATKKVVRAPLQDARHLAERQLFGEAIHVLLLRTLRELSHISSEPIALSLTSREILDQLQLSPAAHGALAGLVEAVEHCHFRGTQPSYEDYDRCLEHFDAFAKAFLRKQT